MICWTEESIILWLAGNDLVTDRLWHTCPAHRCSDARALGCTSDWKLMFLCLCICYYFCICICVYIWFVFIVLCIVCICGTQLLVCSSDQYLTSDAPGVATHYWLDRHICVDSDDDEVLVWKLEALTGMIIVKLGLSLCQRYLKTWGSTPWSEWASDIEALPEHLTDWQPTTPCHYQWSIISWDQNLEPDVWHVHYEVCTIVVNQWCFTVFLTHYIDGIVYIEPNSWHMYREDS